MESVWQSEVAAAYALVADDLKKVEDVLAEWCTAEGALLTSVNLYGVQGGGKRLRPALVALTSRLGTRSEESVHATAAAIELTHVATLHHDDVIDEGDLRRGRPSVPAKWGNAVAVLAGDYLFARASTLATNVGGKIPWLLSEAMAKLVEGQVMELEVSFNPGRTVDHYMKTIEGKTVALLHASAVAGAILAELPAETRHAISAFGYALGNAFQIADDLLDLASNEAELGKSPGTDLKLGVYTLPVLLAVQARPDLADQLGHPAVDVEAVRTAVIDTGAFDEAFRLATNYVNEAISALDALPPGEIKDALTSLAEVIVRRVPNPTPQR